jgi:hypothetical protein
MVGAYKTVGWALVVGSSRDLERDALNDDPEISILKPLWTRRPDGRWGIHDLKGITLKRRNSSDKGLFAVASKMEMLTTTPPTNLRDLFSSFGPTDFLMKQSIVPIVAWKEGAPAIRCIGTGFIVSCTGFLITATHVLIDLLEGGYAIDRHDGSVEAIDGWLMGVLMPNNPAASGSDSFSFIPFLESWYWGKWLQSPLFHEKDTFNGLTDIAVCKLPELADGGAYQPLNLSLHAFSRLEIAYAIGYARMKDIPVEYVEGRSRVAKFDWDLYVSTGEVIDIFPRNHVDKAVPTPGPCFDFRALIPGKMSGAPIFGARGAIVRGVVSRSFSGEEHAFGCMVSPAMTLPLGDGSSLTKLMSAGTEGMGIVHGEGL